MCDGGMVTLHDARFHGGDKFHPFQSGIVTDVFATFGVSIATRSGEIRAVCSRAGRIGSRLFTSREMLEDAMLYEPNYSAQGDSNA